MKTKCLKVEEIDISFELLRTCVSELLVTRMRFLFAGESVEKVFSELFVSIGLFPQFVNIFLLSTLLILLISTEQA